MQQPYGLGRAPLDLSDGELVYVFDALLACEATWHQGQALVGRYKLS